MRTACLAPLLLLGCLRPDALPDRPGEIGYVPIVVDGACAPSREERVACTLDGDTFDVGACGDDVGERIRMLGIDAPEIAHENPADCFGDAAADELRDAIDGEPVLLSFDGTCVDMYGRSLAYVWLQNPADPEVFDVLLNEWMLAEGFARLYEIEQIRLLPRLADAESAAREAGLGLWSQCDE